MNPPGSVNVSCHSYKYFTVVGKALFPGSSTMNQIDKIMSCVPRPDKKDLESVNSPFAKSILDQLATRYTHPPFNWRLQ